MPLDDAHKAEWDQGACRLSLPRQMPFGAWSESADWRERRFCDAPGGRKREMIVQHREPGRSVVVLMISHAKAQRKMPRSLSG